MDEPKKSKSKDKSVKSEHKLEKADEAHDHEDHEDKKVEADQDVNKEEPADAEKHE